MEIVLAVGLRWLVVDWLLLCIPALASHFLLPVERRDGGVGAGAGGGGCMFLLGRTEMVV